MDEPLFQFDSDARSRIRKAVRRVERISGGGGGGDSGSSQTRTIYARLTARDETDPYLYSWEEVILQPDGSWALDDGGLSGTATGTSTDNPAMEIGGLGIRCPDAIVLLRSRMVETGEGVYEPFWVFDPPEQFPCLLEMTSGDAGSWVAECTFVYSIWSEDDAVTLAVGKSPELSYRLLLAPITAATKGLASLSWVAGVPVIRLLIAAETIGQGNCVRGSGS